MSKFSRPEVSILKEFKNVINVAKENGIEFAVVGNAGFGKTSTVNVLFNVNMPTNPAIPGQDVNVVRLTVKNAQRVPKGITEDAALTVYDFQGLGEGNKANSKAYFESYQRELPKADVILWILRADVRMYEFDIDRISQLVESNPTLKSRIIIGLNYADAIGPDKWDEEHNQPSDKQEEQLKIVVERVRKLVYDQCGLESKVVTCYSSKQAWKLDTLFKHLVDACPEEKKWVLADMKQNYIPQFLSKIPPQYRRRAKQILASLNAA